MINDRVNAVEEDMVELKDVEDKNKKITEFIKKSSS